VMLRKSLGEVLDMQALVCDFFGPVSHTAEQSALCAIMF